MFLKNIFIIVILFIGLCKAEDGLKLLLLDANLKSSQNAKTDYYRLIYTKYSFKANGNLQYPVIFMGKSYTASVSVHSPNITSDDKGMYEVKLKGKDTIYSITNTPLSYFGCLRLWAWNAGRNNYLANLINFCSFDPYKIIHVGSEQYGIDHDFD